MKRALVIGDDSNNRRTVDVLTPLLAAGYDVVCLSLYQPSTCIEPLPATDACAPMVHPHLRWHCFDVSDDRYYFGIDNALQGAPIDVLVYLADPEYFSLVRASVGDLAGYIVAGPNEVAMMLKDLDALVQLGTSNSGSGAHV